MDFNFLWLKRVENPISDYLFKFNPKKRISIFSLLEIASFFFEVFLFYHFIFFDGIADCLVYGALLEDIWNQ